MASKLFAMVDDSEIMKHPNQDISHEDVMPSKGKDDKFRFDYKNRFLNLEFSIKVLPEVYEPYELDTRKDDPYFPDTYTVDQIHDKKYVYRKKIYIKERSRSNYSDYAASNNTTVPEFEYFLNMFDDYMPFLNAREVSDFPGATDLQRELMLIEYGTPFATDEDVEYQKIYNSYCWGKEHSDELLGGLHLGENSQEFQILNGEEYEYVNQLNDDQHMIWMYGEFAKPYGFNDCFHRMVPQKKDKNKYRYSIIFNLGLEDQ